MDLLAAGSWAIFDRFLKLDRMPRTGDTLNIHGTVEEIETFFWGGCSYNAAVAAAKLGVKSGVLTVEGRDYISEGYEAYLKNIGVDTKGTVVLEDELSGHGFLVIDSEHNSIVLGALGAGLRQKEQTPNEEIIKNARALVASPTFDAFTLEACRLAKKHGLTVAVNGSLSTWPEVAEDFVRTIDIIFNNEFEIKSLMELMGLTDRRQLFDVGIKALFVTLGKRGCLVQTAESEIMVPPAYNKGSFEPTGAGDSFVGGTMSGILLGYDNEISARIGNIEGSFVIEKTGSQTNLPNWDQMAERYERSYGEKIPPPPNPSNR